MRVNIALAAMLALAQHSLAIAIDKRNTTDVVMVTTTATATSTAHTTIVRIVQILHL